MSDERIVTDKDIQEDSNSELEVLVKKLSPAQYFLMAIIVGLFIYFPIRTQPVLNFNNATQQAIYAVSDPTHLVPKDSVTPVFAIVGIIALLLLLYTFIKDRPLNMLTPSQAMDILEAEMEKKRERKVPEFQGVIKVGPQFYLRKFFDKTNNPIPIEYVINLTILKDNFPKYYLAGIKAAHPFQGYPTKLMGPRAVPFREEDICPNCGKFSDVKMIESPGLRDLKGMREALRSAK